MPRRRFRQTGQQKEIDREKISNSGSDRRGVDGGRYRRMAEQ